MDKHIEAGVLLKDWRTSLGIGLLTLSLAFTVAAFLVKDPPAPPAPKVVSPAAPGAKTGGGGGRAFVIHHVA